MEPKIIRDNTPGLRPAGKRIPREGNARQCLDILSSRASTPDQVKPFRGMTQSAAGTQRVFYSFANDPPVAKEMRHGVSSKSSLDAGHLVNPVLNTTYKQTQLDIKENLYASRRNAPLGSAHDQEPGLPEGLNTLTTTFGRPVVRGDMAGDVVSPAKTPAQVMEESTVGNDLYKKSHLSYDIGETFDRNYDWSKFTKSSLYGVPTPHDTTGKQVRDSLHWLTQAQNERKAPIVVKRVDDYREKAHHQLGKVFDPIADTLTVPEGYTFGVMVQPDEYGAGKLLQLRSPSLFDNTQDQFNAGVLSTIRQHLKLSNFHSLEALQDAIQQKDKDMAGVIGIESLQELFFQFGVPLEEDMLKMLINWCRVPEATGLVHYPLLLHYINWKDSLPSDKLNSTTIGSIPSVQLANKMAASSSTEDASGGEDQQATPSKEVTIKSPLQKQDQPVLVRTPGGSYRTSSQVIGATVGNVSNARYPTCGVPTIRADKAAPRIKRVSDNTNYGDESDACGVIQPSIYSNRGVYEKDFFQSRSEEEIKAVFESIGVSLPPEVFKQLWDEASKRHPNGEVSVESFRAVMEEVQALQVAVPT